jgi:hypothetical protein
MQHYKILSKYNSHDQIPGNIGKVRYMAHMGTREMHTGFGHRRPEGKKPLVKTRSRREGSTEINLTEVCRCSLN